MRRRLPSVSRRFRARWKGGCERRAFRCDERLMTAPKRRWVLLALAGAAILLLAARAVAQIYVDYEWFEAAGALEVWRARTWSALVMRLLSGLAAGLCVFVNLYAVRHSIVSLDLPRT